MKYVEPLKPVLYMGLRNFDEHQVSEFFIIYRKLDLTITF